MERYFEIELIELFKKHLLTEEKSTVTVEKYLRDVRAFFTFVGEEAVTKENVIEYKKNLIDKRYAVASINSMIASINSFFEFCGWVELKVKGIRKQKQIYCTENRELTKEEYRRLLAAAKEKPRLRLLLQTMCSTGIRVSELSYFTVEAVKMGEIVVACKSKTRTVLIPRALKKLLLRFSKQNQISSGIIFRTRTGRALNRSNIWKEMKEICKEAKVNESKVFPHNLRKLFARTFYKLEKDIAKLADILGHSNINTTRIYIVSTGIEHRRKIERLNLLE